jgi:hypothetical protein
VFGGRLRHCRVTCYAHHYKGSHKGRRRKRRDPLGARGRAFGALGISRSTWPMLNLVAGPAAGSSLVRADIPCCQASPHLSPQHPNLRRPRLSLRTIVRRSGSR